MNIDFIKNVFLEPPEVKYASATLRNAGMTEKYLLEKQWSLILCDYTADVYLNAMKYPVSPGYVVLVPPGTQRQFDFKSRACHRTTHFVPQVEIGEDIEIIPMVVNAAEGFGRLLELHGEVVKFFTGGSPACRAVFWHMLWGFIESLTPKTSSIHPELVNIAEYIESHISENINVELLVENSNMSHNQLLRIFHRHYGCSMIQYIRRRRMALVRHMLLNTDMPVKEIAFESGIPDLQAFNKAVRKKFGCSPRKLREQAEEG
jgi:AraC-like DNA-binding protein